MLQGNGATTVAYPCIASTLAESCLDEFPLLRVHPMCLHSPGLSNLPHQKWPRAEWHEVSRRALAGPTADVVLAGV
jgi:hypothetical protein